LIVGVAQQSVGVLALVDLARRKQGWGARRRRGIGNLAAPGG
jgi:hypothetical protein